MDRIVFHYNSVDNINKYYLAQHVEWYFKEQKLLFYNSLFDSVVITKPQSIEAGKTFVSALERGCDNIMALIIDTYSQSAEAIYSLMINKKVIE